MSEPVIEIHGLCFSFNGQQVLKNVNLKINAGDFVAMIGPNGGGKTSLLKLMLGLLKPDSGSVRIFGKPPREVSHRIGYVPQDVHLNKSFPITTLDAVLTGRLNPAKRWSRHSNADRTAATEALNKMEMGAFCHRRIGELSGGQRQRVLIARALVTQPDLLFLDEPTASIDTKGQTEFHALLRDLNQTVTIVLVSHDLMMISSFVKSVACVSGIVHYHDEAEITDEMINMYHCPVELVAHGLPHRVLSQHEEK